METTGTQDTRQRAVSSIEEAGTLLGMIPKLLDDNDGLHAGAEAADKESESLRAEIDALRGELRHFIGEREDLAEIMGRIATDTSRLGEMVARSRPVERKSPFWRDPGPAVPPPPASAPAAATGTAWR